MGNPKAFFQRSPLLVAGISSGVTPFLYLACGAWI
jgi:hypothetical protein